MCKVKKLRFIHSRRFNLVGIHIYGLIYAIAQAGYFARIQISEYLVGILIYIISQLSFYRVYAIGSVAHTQPAMHRTNKWMP